MMWISNVALAIGLIAAPMAVSAQTPVASQRNAGVHPEDHGPPSAAANTARERAPATVAQPAARPAPRAFTAQRRWHMTAGHVRSCKRRYKTYNARTNRFVARPGVLRRCVL